MALTVILFCCPKLPSREAEKAKGGVLFCSIFSLNSGREVDVAVNAATHFTTESFFVWLTGVLPKCHAGGQRDVVLALTAFSAPPALRTGMQ